MLIAERLQEEDTPYRIITPYDAQRSALERALKEKELNWHDKCFNVDSFQGSFNRHAYPGLLTHPNNQNRERRPRYCDFRSPIESSWILGELATDKCHAYSMPARHVHCLQQGIPSRERCRLASRRNGRRVGKTAWRLAHSKGYRRMEFRVESGMGPRTTRARPEILSALSRMVRHCSNWRGGRVGSWKSADMRVGLVLILLLWHSKQARDNVLGIKLCLV